MFLCDSLYELVQIDHQFAKMKNSFLLKNNIFIQFFS